MPPPTTFLGLDGSTWISVALGALAGALVSYLFYLKQKLPKRIEWMITNRVTLRTDRSFDNKWSLAIVPNLDGGTVTRLSNADLYTLRFQNTGKQAISPDDLYEQLRISVLTGFVVDVAITGCSTNGMVALGPVNPAISDRFTRSESVELPRILMNPGEWIDTQLIVIDSTDDLPTVDCRIIGQTRAIRLNPDTVSPQSPIQRKLLLAASLACIALLIAALTVASFSN